MPEPGNSIAFKEFVLARSANRTEIIPGKLAELDPGFNSRGRISLLRIINKTAH